MIREHDRRTVSQIAAGLLAACVVLALLSIAAAPASAQGNGNTFLVVRAAGMSGGEQLDVRVSGTTVGTATLSGSRSLSAFPNWANYSFAVPTSVSAGDLSLHFVNDAGHFTDVRVDHIRLHGETIETEGPGVVTVGGWGNGAGCRPGEWHVDYLACGGEIRYPASGGGSLTIVLAGETGDELVNLRIGGTYIDTMQPPASGQSFRTNPNWREFTYNVGPNVTLDDIAIQFWNDSSAPGYDRNIRVDKIVLNGLTVETEGPGVIVGGGFVNDRCRTGSFGLDSLECNGEITYTTDPATPTPSGSGRQLAEDTKNRLAKTMNLGNALEAPNEGEWGMVIEDWMFPTIKQGGFTAVRVPIRWSAHAQQHAPYTIDADWFARVDHVINQARQHDLAVVINMHHYDELNNDPFGHRDRFLGMWRQIAERYQHLDETVSFELLNEPFGNLEPHWNDFVAQALSVVRESNPNRTALIGPTGFNKLNRLEKLVLPDDDNLVLSVHYYEPFDVTHQQASWVTFDDGSLIYPNTQTCCDEAVEDQIRRDMEFIGQWARNRNRPVFIGEFGVLSTGDNFTRVDWTAHTRWRSQDQGFAWAYWEFGEGFGVFDPANCQWNQSLHNALIPLFPGQLDADGVGCR